LGPVRVGGATVLRRLAAGVGTHHHSLLTPANRWCHGSSSLITDRMNVVAIDGCLGEVCVVKSIETTLAVASVGGWFAAPLSHFDGHPTNVAVVDGHDDIDDIDDIDGGGDRNDCGDRDDIGDSAAKRVTA
ncbi:MAG: hypothetical protein WBM50_14500, partial [Acidimicrobiales bacterium]